MNQNTKSSLVAGLLGIFLGAFGAHNWYLGEKSKGIAHVCLMSGGVIVEILAAAVLPNVMSFTMLFQMAWLFTILTAAAGLAMSASAIWGLVEGITILVQGDAGLARKGYAVAQPVPMQGYGQPMNNGYNQPMNGFGPSMGGGYNQPMGQPMGNGFGQPMNQPMNNGQPMNQPMNNGMGWNNMNGNMNNMNGGMNNMNNMNGGMNNMNGNMGNGGDSGNAQSNGQGQNGGGDGQ